MRQDIGLRRNDIHEQEEPQQGVQSIGNVLNELFAQYRTRFPNLNVMVVAPRRPSEAGQR
jgi:hypothetical protein